MMARVALVLAVLLVAVGCAQTAKPPGPQPEERFGAPLPIEPRDTRAVSAAPCRSLLTPGQWQELGFDPEGEVVVLPTGERSCERRGTRRAHVNVGVASNRDILVDTYRVRQFAIFTPAAVGGLPGTIEQTRPDSISCNVTVGTARGQGFLVIYDGFLDSNGQPDDPCGRAEQIAERIVASLPPLPAK
jgi:hypothetical protein